MQMLEPGFTSTVGLAAHTDVDALDTFGLKVWGRHIQNVYRSCKESYANVMLTHRFALMSVLECYMKALLQHWTTTARAAQR